MTSRFVPILLFGALGACASRSAPPPAEPPVSPTPVASRPEHVDGAITQVSRAELVSVIDAGLGKFLQDAEFEAEYSEGRYVGYRVVRIINVERYRGVGIEPGDVIVKINGASIEREGDAFDVFRSLRTASHIEVDYLRAGDPMHLSLPIVGELPKVAEPQPGGAPPAPPVAPEKLTVPPEKPAAPTKPGARDKGEPQKGGQSPSRQSN